MTRRSASWTRAPSPAGKLVNGSYSLAHPLQGKATNPSGMSSAYAAPSGTPRTLLTSAGPVSSEAVTLGFKQSTGASDPLRTGAYSTTLSTTMP